MSKLIVNCDVAKSDADLSKIPAFIHQDGSVEYWDSLSKPVALEMWSHAMGLTVKYSIDQVGSLAGSEILGCLEDEYPEWVEEFESRLSV